MMPLLVEKYDEVVARVVRETSDRYTISTGRVTGFR